MSVLDSLRSASPRRQLLVGVTIAVALCALLAAVYFLFLRKPYAELYTGLRPADAAAIVAELDKKKTPYKLAAGGTTILVPQDQVEAVRLATVSQDLPIKGMVGFELFNKSDMGLTEFAQRINYQRALQGELARTIMAMDGVDTARVHLSLTEATVFRDDRRPPKASVAVLMRPGMRLSQAMVGGIQRLVAASVPELDPGAVVVLDDHGKVLSADAQPAVVGASGQQRAIEEYYAGKVRQALDKAYPGAGYDVTVTALTELDPAATAQPAPSSAEGETPPAAESGPALLEGWTPATRKFRLKVDVALAAPLSPRVREEMRAVANDAIGFDPALGDTVSVAVAAGPSTGGMASDGAVRPLPGPAQAPDLVAIATSPSLFWEFLLAPALVGLLVLAFVLYRRKDTRRGLDDGERADYARRLKLLLEQGEADAAPPV